MTMKFNLLFALIIGSLTSLGCSDPAAPYGPGPSIDALFVKIVGGRLTAERPEVGSISMNGSGCTATLVAPDVVITAAHCLNYGTRRNRGDYGSFTIETRAARRSFTVTQYVSFGRDLGRDDVALLQLETPVPNVLAQPAAIATQAPAPGSTLTVYGYGCTHRAGNSDWQKRKASFAQGRDSSYLCPGDSGGPVFDETTGSVLRINSGYWMDSAGTDIYGDIPANFARLHSAIDELSDHGGGPGAGRGGGGGGVDNDPTVGLSTVCGFHVQAKKTWMCNPDGLSRSRCRKGHAPEEEACNAGCNPGAIGQPARCGVQVSQPRCGDAYEAFADWTCTAEGRHMLRCNEGLVEVHRCRQQCSPGQPMDRDVCLGR